MADTERQHAEDVLARWQTNMTLFRHDISGDVCERDAMIAELGDLFGGGFWDLTRVDLATCLRDMGMGWEPVPFWYALYHLPFDWRESTYASELNDGGEHGD